MKRSLGREIRRHAAALWMLGLVMLCAVLWSRAESPARTPETVVQHWPEHSRVAALALIEKYGEPTRFDDFRLAWSDDGPWSNIVVYRDAPRNIVGWRGKDVVQQSVWYDPPDDKIPELKRFDRRIEVDKSTGEMRSRAENEALNFLALNLADEIVTGKRSVSEAREYYRKTIEFSTAGKSSPYMMGLLFSFHIPR